MSSSSSVAYNENPPLTGINLKFQELEERVINETNTPSIIESIGCNITIKDIQSVKRKMKTHKFDLKMDVNENQRLPTRIGSATPLIHFCKTGNLLIIKILFLIGADCTKLDKHGMWFPMLAAAQFCHLDICQWLFEYGRDAKDQINRETITGDTPLRAAFSAWQDHGIEKGGKTCKWLLRNGGGQHFSSRAMRRFLELEVKEELNSNLLVMWMRENILLHDTFMLLLCGVATTMVTSSSSSSSEPSDCGTRKSNRQRLNQEQRSLQILNGHSGIMELIGEKVGLIRGKEVRMLQEFNELVIKYINTYYSSSSDDDDDDDDDDDL